MAKSRNSPTDDLRQARDPPNGIQVSNPLIFHQHNIIIVL